MMVDETPLYDDGALKIENNPRETEGHILHIGERAYALPRGVLDDFSRTPRGSLEVRISPFNPNILFALEQENIGIDRLQIAISQAYIEEEKRISNFQLDKV